VEKKGALRVAILDRRSLAISGLRRKTQTAARAFSKGAQLQLRTFGGSDRIENFTNYSETVCK
jgi:hypothetical protein